MGAASLDLCSVAIGRVDAYYEWGMMPWDWAAGALVATEAGARVANLDGSPLGVDGKVLAAHPALWDELAELLIRAGREGTDLTGPAV
jgi:myo-inositol-1(or 4)-monophosphatase